MRVVCVCLPLVSCDASRNDMRHEASHEPHVTSSMPLHANQLPHSLFPFKAKLMTQDLFFDCMIIETIILSFLFCMLWEERRIQSTPLMPML